MGLSWGPCELESASLFPNRNLSARRFEPIKGFMSATTWRRYFRKRRARFAAGSMGIGLLVGLSLLAWNEFGEKRVSVVLPGRVIRGAWQRPWPLRRILHREQVQTILTLTAINRDDPKYVEQDKIVREEGIGWLIIPMRGSTATLEQLATAADLATDPSRQPVFFHCVAGHHRSNLVQAAIRIRHQGWTASRAWAELITLDWTNPDAEPDLEDRALIEEFFRVQGSIPRVLPEQGRELTHAI